MLIPLKKKYRSAHKGRFRGGERFAEPKRRNKVGYEKHIARYGVPPKMVMVVDGLRGTSIMKREG